MKEEVEEEYKAAATVDSRRACPSGCPRAVRGGVTGARPPAGVGWAGPHPTVCFLPVSPLGGWRVGITVPELQIGV